MAGAAGPGGKRDAELKGLERGFLWVVQQVFFFLKSKNQQQPQTLSETPTAGSRAGWREGAAARFGCGCSFSDLGVFSVGEAPTHHQAPPQHRFLLSDAKQLVVLRGTGLPFLPASLPAA